MEWLRSRLDIAASCYSQLHKNAVEYYLYTIVAVLLVILMGPSLAALADQTKQAKASDQLLQPSNAGIQSVREVGPSKAPAPMAGSRAVPLKENESQSAFDSIELDAGTLAGTDAGRNNNLSELRVRKPLYRDGKLIGSLFIKVDAASRLHVELSELRRALGNAGNTYGGIEQLPRSGQASFAMLRDFGIDIRYDPEQDVVTVR